MTDYDQIARRIVLDNAGSCKAAAETIAAALRAAHAAGEGERCAVGWDTLVCINCSHVGEPPPPPALSCCPERKTVAFGELAGGYKAGVAAGVRNAFDWVLAAAANNYSGNPVVQAEKTIENRAMENVAEDFLEELAPEFYQEWKSISEAHEDGYEAGVAAERERCAKVAQDRHKQWHADMDNCEVCDDESACADIAAAIRKVKS